MTVTNLTDAGVLGAAAPSAERDGEAVGTVDVVLGYRNPRKMERLVRRTGTKLRIVDATTAYYRLEAKDFAAGALFTRLQDVLRMPVSRPSTFSGEPKATESLSGRSPAAPR